MSNPKITKSRTNNLAKLNAYEPTPSTVGNVLQNSVKDLYKRGVIRNIKDATNLMDMLQANEIQKFATRLRKIEDAETKKSVAAMDKEKKEDEEAGKHIVIKERAPRAHALIVKNRLSELPTFEVHYKKLITTFEAAWKTGVKPLTRAAEKKIQEKKNIKISIGMEVKITKATEGGGEQTARVHAHTMPEAVYNEGDVTKMIADKKADLQSRIEQRVDYQVGSGWSIEAFTVFYIKTYTQKPSRGSSYIPTPEKFKNAKCGLVNIQNEDELCFKYCMLYHQTSKGKHDSRVTVLKKVADKYKWEGIGFPASFNDVEKFEHLNQVCINVWGISEANEVHPLRLGSIPYIKNDTINLLLLHDGEKGHYVYIKKLEHLLHCITKGDYKDRKYCPYCKKTVPVEENFEDHIMSKHYDCNNDCNLELPAEGATMKFKNFKNMMERPFVVYADFECSLLPTDMADKVAKHEPNSAMCYFVCTYDSSRNKLYKFEGVDCVINMIEQLRVLSKRCIEEMQHNQDMKLTEADKKDFCNATQCHICKGPFGDKCRKVRDHCHRTGCYRGAAHNACNINYYLNRYLPVVFHNLRGYDSHIFLKKAFEVIGETKESIDAIPQSGEKMMTFKIGDLKFIDSYQFLGASLDKLVESLKSPGPDPYKDFNNMKREFPLKQELQLMCRKGVYPYEYITKHSKIHDPTLPPKEAFYSNLRLEGITDAEYSHAQNVYSTFKCKTFFDYHMLYLKTDVLLLADVFENFRQMSLT